MTINIRMIWDTLDGNSEGKTLTYFGGFIELLPAAKRHILVKSL